MPIFLLAREMIMDRLTVIDRLTKACDRRDTYKF